MQLRSVPAATRSLFLKDQLGGAQRGDLRGCILILGANPCVAKEHRCANLLLLQTILQYLYAPRNALLNGRPARVAQTTVCATEPRQFLTPKQRAHYGRYFHLDDTDQALIGAKRGDHSDHNRLRFGLTRPQSATVVEFFVT